ncbi:MAG TPA: GAF domain-containing protein [Anaerolineales bacterium]|nr:GAF domain-containing protein [Anaerolineales bacterium]
MALSSPTVLCYSRGMGLRSDTNPMHMLQLEVARLKDENRGLRDEIALLHSSIRALSALQDLIERLSPKTPIIDLLDDLLRSVLMVVGASAGSLLLVDEDTGELVFAVVHGPARERLTGYRLPRGQGIAGWVVSHRQPQVVHDVRTDPQFSPLVDETFDFQTRSLAALPLLDGDRVLGVIEALNKSSDREFTQVDNDLLKVVAQLAAAALVRAEALTSASPAEAGSAG